MGVHFHDEASVTISGPSAYLLRAMFRAEPVREFLRRAGWLSDSPAFAAVVIGVNAAASAHDQQLRSNALRCEPDPPAGDTLISVEQASELLGLGRRQVQELARRRRIDSRKVGGHWQLSRASVAAYGEQRGRALCRTWNGSRDDITRNCHTATN
jgi:excisionase family DNA binding protein